jgi:hypothetical protein
MDFDQLKKAWKKAEDLSINDSDKELNRRLQAVTSTQRKIRQYFRYEMIIAVTAIFLFGSVVYFLGDLENYFYKLFVLIVLGSVPLNIRLFLSMKRILGIDYTRQLQKNLSAAKNHLKVTIRIYYSVVVFTVISLVFMSWMDEFFLQLPTAWQGGIMSYFLLFLIVSIYFVNKFYGSKLKGLEELLEDM